MSDAKIISEVPISMTDLLVELKKIEKRDAEVNFRVTKVNEYLGRFLKLKKKEHDDLVQKITELSIPRLKEYHIIKIADMLPTSPEEIKMVLQGYPLSLSADSLKKIASTVRDALPTKK